MVVGSGRVRQGPREPTDHSFLLYFIHAPYPLPRTAGIPGSAARGTGSRCRLWRVRFGRVTGSSRGDQECASAGPDRVATRVEALAQSYGLRCLTGHLALGPGASETLARTRRYAWLEETRQREGAAFIFTAHHADDQVETVLLRLLHGSGPAGLAAMASQRGPIVRPLLPFRRVELVQYLHQRGLEYWDDPSNSDPAHERSWLRGTLIPAIRARLPEFDENLLRVAQLAREDRDGWDLVMDHLPGLDWRVEPGGGSVAAAVLAGYDSTLGKADWLPVGP